MRSGRTRIAVALAMVLTSAALFYLDERGECIPLAVAQLALAVWVFPWALLRVRR